MGLLCLGDNTCYLVIEVAPGRFQVIDLANGGQVVERLPGVAQEWTSRQAVEAWAQAGGHTLRNGTVTASQTMSQAVRRARDAAGIPRSMQPTRQWTINPPEARTGAGVVHADPGHQGRIFEFEITVPGGQRQYRYIVVHDVDPTHGGIGHVHIVESPRGPTERLSPTENYHDLATLLPEGQPIPFLER